MGGFLQAVVSGLMSLVQGTLINLWEECVWVSDVCMITSLITLFVHTECPAGCSLCNGPQNTDCLACSDGAQFLDTTNRLDSPCVDSCPSNRGVAENIDQFGRRTCIGEQLACNIPSVVILSLLTYIEAPTTTDAAMVSYMTCVR